MRAITRGEGGKILRRFLDGVVGSLLGWGRGLGLWAVYWCCFDAADAGGNTLLRPPEIRLDSATFGGSLEEFFLIAGRKGLVGGEKGVKGLARFGNRWPSGARSTQPQPDGPGSRGISERTHGW